MLKHCVFVNFKAEISDELRRSTVSAFAELMGQIDGMVDFSAGRNLDFEGKSPAYPWGFIVSFANRAALAAYDANPLHQKYGAQLVARAEGGHAGIIVFDLHTD